VRNGTTTNDSALSGQIGQYISATVLVGAAVALTNNTPTNITSISLTPGDWDVTATVADNPAGTTVPATLFGAISTTTSSLGTSPRIWRVCVEHKRSPGWVRNDNADRDNPPGSGINHNGLSRGHVCVHRFYYGRLRLHRRTAGALVATNPLSINVPQPGIPFLDPAGNVSRAWLYYLLTLLTRTGGVQGISSSEIVIQTTSVAFQQSMDDVVFPAPFPVLSMVSAMDDVPTPTSIAPAALLALSLVDDAAQQPINPILAALLVSDAA
jgi:hypothetical protein